MPKNVGDLGKLIVAKGFKKSPKVQKIARSGHTDGFSSADRAWKNNLFIFFIFKKRTFSSTFFFRKFFNFQFFI